MRFEIDFSPGEHRQELITSRRIRTGRSGHRLYQRAPRAAIVAESPADIDALTAQVDQLLASALRPGTGKPRAGHGLEETAGDVDLLETLATDPTYSDRDTLMTHGRA
jgi:alkanesulfonate monooxygenase SsuD/methylene tetrahydromethanopterin reductase-like flavin-dependent oxidoreductase (luciferase family)